MKSLVPKLAKMLAHGAAEAVSVGEQHDDGGDSPSHAEHGQGGAAPVVAHRVVGLAQKVVQHKK